MLLEIGLPTSLPSLKEAGQSILYLPVVVIVFGLAGLVAWAQICYAVIPLGMLTTAVLKWICRNDPMPADPIEERRRGTHQPVELDWLENGSSVPSDSAPEEDR